MLLLISFLVLANSADLVFTDCPAKGTNTGEANVIQCNDGTKHDMTADPSACKCRGGRHKCPSNFPYMCAPAFGPFVKPDFYPCAAPQVQGTDFACVGPFAPSLCGAGSATYVPHSGVGVGCAPDPTPFPSKTPTTPPSSSPSTTPSSSPSNSPSPAPTDPPSLSPSKSPSSPPTDQPSSPPTDIPSRAPTDQPSSPPTDIPSRAPTYEPSFSPSRTPTFTPSRTPTFPPSNSPTFPPSNSPTLPPSTSPSKSPSPAPTVLPTLSPTECKSCRDYDGDKKGCLKDSTKLDFMCNPCLWDKKLFLCTKPTCASFTSYGPFKCDKLGVKFLAKYGEPQDNGDGIDGPCHWDPRSEQCGTHMPTEDEVSCSEWENGNDSFKGLKKKGCKKIGKKYIGCKWSKDFKKCLAKDEEIDCTTLNARRCLGRCFYTSKGGCKDKAVYECVDLGKDQCTLDHRSKLIKRGCAWDKQKCWDPLDLLTEAPTPLPTAFHCGMWDNKKGKCLDPNLTEGLICQWKKEDRTCHL